MRGYILSALRRADEAVREERLSMEIDPRLHRYSWALGRSLLRARQYDAGIAELLARAEVQPEDEEVHELFRISTAEEDVCRIRARISQNRS